MERNKFEIRFLSQLRQVDGVGGDRGVRNQKLSRMGKRVLFVGDGGEPAALEEALADDDIQVIPHVQPLSLSLGTLGRHLGYLRLAFFAARNREQFDCILIWQQFIALYYCLLAALMPRAKSTPAVLYYIIYKKSSNGLVNWIKHRVMRAMVNSRKIAVVYFMSRSDYLYRETDPVKRRLLVYCPFNSDYIEKHPALIGSVGRFYFSGGASNRNYFQIRQLAELLADSEFGVAGLPALAHVFRPCPPNVKLHTDVYGDEFEDLVLRSRAVIIPLADPMVTSGQMVVLAAMQAGKAVFITRNNFVDDWVGRDRAAGFLYEYESLEQLSHMLRTMTDAELALRGKRAREYFLEHNDERTIYRSFAEQVRMALKNGKDSLSLPEKVA